MAVLAVGRGQGVVDTVVAAMRARGIDGLGVSTDADAAAHLQAGSITAVVIGGGVEADSRETLKRHAATAGVLVVIEEPLAGRASDRYVRQVILPRLTTPSPRTRRAARP